MTDSKKSISTYVAMIAWGGVLAAWVVRGFFVHPEGQIHKTHEDHSYVYRLVEFREALAAGHYSPQWCTNFRSGLGSPYFSYYQPGLFYVASLTGFLDPVHSLGITLWLFSLVGYLGMFALLQRFFDTISGWLAGSLLLLSVYAGTELYVRGDLSEYAGMMLLPPILHNLLVWLETGRTRSLGFYIGFSAGLVVTHPCVALPGFGAFCLVSLAYTAATRRWWTGLIALAAQLLAGMLAAFYWMPVLFEWDLVQGSNAFEGYYHYAKHFVHPLWLVEPYSRSANIPFTLGWVLIALLPFNAVALYLYWKTLSAEQHRLVRTLAVIPLLCFMLMTSVSKSLWDNCLLLQRLQFPWRLLTLATVSLVGICGPTLWRLQPRPRLVTGAFIVGLAWWLSIDYTRRNPARAFTPVQSARQIADAEFFFSDRANEFVPKHARADFPDGLPKLPTAPSGIDVTNFQRDTGRLTCQIQATQSGYVTLPHYFFPGWRAKLNGNDLALRADAAGLMQVALSPNDTGRIEVRFGSTPARRLGWIVTWISVLFAVVFVVVIRRWHAPSAGDA